MEILRRGEQEGRVDQNHTEETPPPHELYEGGWASRIFSVIPELGYDETSDFCALDFVTRSSSSEIIPDGPPIVGRPRTSMDF